MAYLIYFVVVLVAAYALRPKPPKRTPATLEELEVPTAEPGRNIPIAFGTVVVKSPNIVWYGDLYASKFKSGGQTVAFGYHLGIHMIVCQEVDEVQAIYADDILVWEGETYETQTVNINGITYQYDAVTGTAPVTSNQTISIRKGMLFGGKHKEGGIEGDVDILMGRESQTRNTYLQSKIGVLDIPAFRGLTSLVLKRCYLGTTQYIKPWSVRVKNIPGKTWFPETSDIDGSANGAHILYEILTSADIGMGLSAATYIADAEWRDAAQALYDEDLGLSLILGGSMDLHAFVTLILNHINAVLYQRRTDGKFVLKLIRADYVLANTLQLDENNIIDYESFERPAYSELVNEVTVNFRPKGTAKDEPITIHNSAVINAQDGAIVNETITFEGIDSKQNALRLGLRELKQRSTPAARIKLKANKTASQLEVGDVFRYSREDLGVVEMPCRVAKINHGTFADGAVRIEAAEDIFGLASTTYIDPLESGWVDPISAPAAPSVRKITELSYWELTHAFPDAERPFGSAVAFVQAMVGQSNTYLQEYDFLIRTETGDFSASTDVGEFAPTGTLEIAIGAAATTIELENAFGLESINLIPQASGEESSNNLGLSGRHAYLGDEIVTILTLDASTNTLTVGRGAVDTVPQSHAVGTRFLIAANFALRHDVIFDADLAETIYARILPRNSEGALLIGDAIEDSLVIAGRANKPYPPANFKINSASYPAEITTSNISISWTHNNRLAFDRTIPAPYAVNLGSPEAGTTYTARLLKLDGTQLAQHAGLTGTTDTFTAAEIGGRVSVRVQLFSVRDAVESHQRHDHQFNIVAFATESMVGGGVSDAEVVEP